MKKFALSLVIFCLFGFGTAIQAQNAIVSSGGNASGDGGTASYSVGQVVYSTYTGTNGSVAQGVQQPYEISVISGIEEAKDISLEIMVYPNPATDFLKLKIENYEVKNLRFQLYDIKGSLLQDNKIVDNETSIVMSTYESGIYFLKVTDKTKLIKTFKIIKH
jgi:hypothetical protein